MTARGLGWIGFDLDGTLAHYEGWTGPGIGRPIDKMVQRLKEYVSKGHRVKIFTARVTVPDQKQLEEQIRLIDSWCLEHIGMILDVTATKDLHMIYCYDDRVRQVVPNEGITIEEALRGIR